MMRKQDVQRFTTRHGNTKLETVWSLELGGWIQQLRPGIQNGGREETGTSVKTRFRDPLVVPTRDHGNFVQRP